MYIYRKGKCFIVAPLHNCSCWVSKNYFWLVSPIFDPNLVGNEIGSTCIWIYNPLSVSQSVSLLDSAKKGVGIKDKIISGQDKDKIQNKG